MDDEIFFGALFYVLVSSLIVASLPSSLFGDTIFTSPDSESLSSEISGSESSTNPLTQISTISKIITFMFLSWQIEGIPLIIGLILEVINLFLITILIIYIYDKLPFTN